MEPTLQVSVSVKTLEEIRNMLKQHARLVSEVAVCLDRNERVMAGHILGAIGGKMKEMRAQIAECLPYPKR